MWLPRIALVCGVLAAIGCNRAIVRLPTGESFPRTLAGYSAVHSIPHSLVVSAPLDLRVQHFGEIVAGTRWRACKTDALDTGEPGRIISERLVQELGFSKLFRDVKSDGSGDLELQTDIHVFCAQAVGFVYLRVAGLTALRFRIIRDGQVLYDRKIERVVTDVDPEYTGSQIGTIEGGMLRVMSDSLREVMKMLLTDLEDHYEELSARGPSP